LRDKLQISAVSLNLSVEITVEAKCALQQLHDENLARIARVGVCCIGVTRFTWRSLWRGVLPQRGAGPEESRIMRFPPSSGGRIRGNCPSNGPVDALYSCRLT